jgi:hypothetical protein
MFVQFANIRSVGEWSRALQPLVPLALFPSAGDSSLDHLPMIAHMTQAGFHRIQEHLCKIGVVAALGQSIDKLALLPDPLLATHHVPNGQDEMIVLGCH